MDIGHNDTFDTVNRYAIILMEINDDLQNQYEDIIISSRIPSRYLDQVRYNIDKAASYIDLVHPSDRKGNLTLPAVEILLARAAASMDDAVEEMANVVSTPNLSIICYTVNC